MKICKVHVILWSLLLVSCASNDVGVQNNMGVLAVPAMFEVLSTVVNDPGECAIDAEGNCVYSEAADAPDDSGIPEGLTNEELKEMAEAERQQHADEDGGS